MATSLTSPGLVFASDKAIIAARPALEKVTLFATDFTDAVVAPGTTLTVPVFSGSAADFNPASSHGYNDTEGAVKWAQVSFSTHKKCTYGLTDKDSTLVETSPLWTKAGIAAGGAVGKALTSVVAGLLTYSAATQVTGWSCTLANVAKLRENCASNNYDPANSVVILEPGTYATLLSLLPSNVIGDGSAVVTGILRGLFGFKAVIEGTQISKASAASTNKGVGYVVPADAICVACRTIQPQDGTCVESGTATDEITGFTFGHRITADQNSGQRNYTVEALMGAALSLQSSNGAPGFLQLVTA